MRALRLTFFLAVTVGFSQLAFAGGFQNDLHDTTGTGRGFARTAGVDDGAAAYYNPASISLLDGTSFSGGLTYITVDVDYFPQSGSGNARSSTERVHAVIPVLNLGLDVSEYVDFGLTIFNPFTLSSNWDQKDWAGRYMALENAINFTFVNPLIAFKIPKIDGLAFAAGPQFVFTIPAPGQSHGIRLNRAIDQQALGVPDGELILEGNTKNFEVGYVLSLIYAPPFLEERLRFGVTWRDTPNEHVIEGDARFKNTSPLLGLIPKDKVRTAIGLPPWLQLGVEVEVIKDQLWVEFDYKWTGWRSLRAIDLNFKTNPDQTIEFDWNNTSMFMLGVEYHAPKDLLEGLEIRAGYFYDQSPVPHGTLRPDLPDGDRHGVSIGLGYKFFGLFKVDISYMKLFFNTLRKNNAEDGSAFGLGNTANGRYATSVDIISVGLTTEF